MIDMRHTIAPKSDQLNADDLISGPMTIRISDMRLMESPEQPIACFYEGDDGRPFKPCKSMRRVMVQVWGPDARAYIGRSMTLYRDPGVMFGGQRVGGIRISHMTHIDKPVTMALTATRANRKPFTVQPLAGASPPDQQQPRASASDFWARDAYHIPVSMLPDGSGSDWAKWALRMRKAADQAPDEPARTKLMADNGPALDGLRAADETAHAALMDALEPTDA